MGESLLAKRIIPTLLADGERLVKGSRFQPWRTVGVVEQAARICGSRAVDEIILLDVTATRHDREPNYDLVRRISASLFTPLTVGGGVRKLAHVRELLRNGADKVAVCTVAIRSPIFVADLAAIAGSQAIVVALDVASTGRLRSDNGEGITDWDPVQFAKLVAYQGAGEILLTSIEREGTMAGYDLELIRSVSQAVDIPVIAHGGAGTYDHMLEAFQAGADAVAAGAMFQFTDATPRGAAEYLGARGIKTRIPMQRGG